MVNGIQVQVVLSHAQADFLFLETLFIKELYCDCFIFFNINGFVNRSVWPLDYLFCYSVVFDFESKQTLVISLKYLIWCLQALHLQYCVDDQCKNGGQV